MSFITEEMKGEFEVIGFKKPDGKIEVLFDKDGVMGKVYESSDEFESEAGSKNKTFSIVEMING